MVVAIVGAITVPCNWNANAGHFATELFILIALIRSHRRASQFVAAIVAIRYAIAFVRFFDALPQIGALELIRQTRYWWTVLFVLFIKAVVVTVAHPRLRYAVAGSRARELEVGTRFLGTKVTFVRSIAAVIFTIAFPHVRNAAAVGTCKLRRRTGHIYAFKFIGMIAAIVLLIAPEIQWNAATRFTLEFVGATSWFWINSETGN